MTIAATDSHPDPAGHRRPSSGFANTASQGSTTARAERLFPMVVALYLSVVFATGGGSQDAGFDDAIVQALALPLAAFATWRLLMEGVGRGSRWPLAIACAIVALPLLQLLPVSPARGDLARDLAVAGVEPTARWSLSRDGSLHAWASMLPAFALFLAVSALPRESHRMLLKALVWLATGSLLLGFVQLGLPQDSPLNPFPQWVPALGGVFANPNHQAIMLGIAAVFALLLGREEWSNPRRSRRAQALALWACGIACVVALPVTGSRAGLLISLAALAAVVLARDHGPARPGFPHRRIVALAALLAGLATAFAAWRWMQVDGIEESRGALRAAVWSLGWRHAPLGAGFGSFVPLFEQEGPARMLGPEFFNHAHDEYVQWWLEGGVPAALLLAGVLWLLARSLHALWRVRAQGRPDAAAACCALGLLMLLAHSWVDFPLRTPALMSMGALLCAILFTRTAGPSVQGDPKNGRETMPARHN